MSLFVNTYVLIQDNITSSGRNENIDYMKGKTINLLKIKS